MNWQSHLLIGVLLGAIVCYFIFSRDAMQVALFASVSGAGALLPDIDLRKSKISRITYTVLGIAALLAAIWFSFGSGKGAAEFVYYLCAIVAGVLIVDFLFRPRHRGITHSLLFLFLLAAAAYFAAGLFASAALACGYFSHLASDNSLKLK